MNKKTIMIVDDEQDMHVLIENLLDDNRFQFVSAMNGEEGYNIIASAKPDLVILDVQMPKMDGFEMLKKLIADNKAVDLPVIFLTGIAEKRGAHFNEKDVKAHFNSDLVSYMEKPLDPDKFIELVDNKLI